MIGKNGTPDLSALERQAGEALRAFVIGCMFQAVSAKPRAAKAVRRVVKVRHAQNNKVSQRLRLHGRYMGLIRTLPPMAKRKAKAVYRDRGLVSAIAFAETAREKQKAA